MTVAPELITESRAIAISGAFPSLTRARREPLSTTRGVALFLVLHVFLGAAVQVSAAIAVAHALATLSWGEFLQRCAAIGWQPPTPLHI